MHEYAPAQMTTSPPLALVLPASAEVTTVFIVLHVLGQKLAKEKKFRMLLRSGCLTKALWQLTMNVSQQWSIAFPSFPAKTKANKTYSIKWALSIEVPVEILGFKGPSSQLGPGVQR
jgi:hypothetical protein